MWVVSMTMGKVTGVKSSVASGNFGLKTPHNTVCVCCCLLSVRAHGSWSSQHIWITALRYIHLHHTEDRSYYAISGFPILHSSIVIWFGWTKENITVITSLHHIYKWYDLNYYLITICDLTNHFILSSIDFIPLPLVPWTPGLKRKFCNSDNIL